MWLRPQPGEQLPELIVRFRTFATEVESASAMLRAIDGSNKINAMLKDAK